MRLLLDTHVLIALARRELADLGSPISAAVSSPDNVLFASAASSWEVAIKARLGKINPGIDVSDLPAYWRAMGLNLLVITHYHVVERVQPDPPTRDPFDRLLLAQCAVEDLRLVTLDRMLRPHPLAYSA